MMRSRHMQTCKLLLCAVCQRCWQFWPRLWVATVCLLTGGLVQAQSVVFINPGMSDEIFWISATDAMRKAADSLGMRLSVVTVERDRLKPMELAQALAQLPAQERPDYLLFSNEYSVAPSVLKALEGSGIKAFMAFSGIHEDLRPQVGLPRARFPFWLGSLESNAEDAGYRTAKTLIAEAQKHPEWRDEQGQWQMLAIAGDRSTPVSITRNQGLLKAVSEAGGAVKLMQLVYGEWRQDKAQQQAAGLFRRYPQARMVWSGNDVMALGAMQAWEEQGGVPGTDAVFSGINTSAQALEKLRKGQLTAMAGGHFLAGAWSMVMLFDYHHGVDFADEGLEQKRPMFMLFDVSNSKRFEQRLGAGSMVSLDFRQFSKYLNPHLKRYDFDIHRLLH